MTILLLWILAGEPCRIEVVEKATGWPVPLVELRTTNHLKFVTDNAGIAAFDAPDLMDREVWLLIRGHGYGVKPDGFGMKGVRIVPRAGKTVRIEVERSIIARRLGRLTGGGLFAEAAKCGGAPAPETGVLGCDSVQNAVFGGKLHWFWGDSNVARSPLGVFHSTGATTSVSPLASAAPPLRLPLTVFRGADGQPRGVAAIPGDGPTWLTGVAALPDATGQERMVCTCFKVRPPLDVHAVGQAEWDASAALFKPVGERWERSKEHAARPDFPEGHAVPFADAAGKKWLLVGDPFPRLKMPATYEAWRDRSQWQSVAAPPAPRDAATGKPVRVHRGMVAWHEFRKRWTAIFCQEGGTPSYLGEIWYCEAPSPFGPWGRAVKVLSHDNYCFYNPVQHPEFAGAAPRSLFFEGTYTNMFADRAEPTPRWEYNQVLYRLDLDDPALAPARGD